MDVQDEQPVGPDEDLTAKEAPAEAPAELGRRLNRAFGPIVAGLIIDTVDLATFGPLGYLAGLPVGGFAGYWMGRCLGLSRRGSFYCALAAGIYCSIPMTEVIPLATLVGAYVRFRESGRRRTDEASEDRPLLPEQTAETEQVR